MVQRIRGKGGGPRIYHLKQNNQLITDTKQISDSLASKFAHNSSTDHYSPKFQRYKRQAERKPLRFRSDNNEEYNQKFSLFELESALNRSPDTSPGPDEVHYQLLKHLPKAALEKLLAIFNHIWITGDFPPSWRKATVIPIAKPGKDPFDPTNYRPIALTSCLCKTMERMINVRLVWYLESNNLLTPAQSGFRKGRCTLDHLVRLETYIREAFLRKKRLIAVFFDLEKAYDTTWKYGIMKDLYDMNIRGRMPLFIENFLKDRSFNVRLGSIISDEFEQEMGVPQGSVLSVTLFSLKINSIVKCLNEDTSCSLYVDDFLICYEGKKMCELLKDNYNSVLTKSSNGQMRMASNSQKPRLSVCTSANQPDP